MSEWYLDDYSELENPRVYGTVIASTPTLLEISINSGGTMRMTCTQPNEKVPFDYPVGKKVVFRSYQ